MIRLGNDINRSIGKMNKQEFLNGIAGVIDTSVIPGMQQYYEYGVWYINTRIDGIPTGIIYLCDVSRAVAVSGLVSNNPPISTSQISFVLNETDVPTMDDSCAGAALAALPVLPEEPSTCMEAVRVMDQDGVGVSGATVTIEGTSVVFSAGAVTNFDGYCAIYEILSGEQYNITVTHSEYITKTVSATLCDANTREIVVTPTGGNGSGEGTNVLALLGGAVAVGAIALGMITAKR